MKRRNATRNALFTSVICLLVCISMLVGTTFAWFTDSVTSSGNKIASGTLQIELYELDKDNNWNDITDSTAALFDYDLWEPGYTDATVLKVQNAGSLALNWAASLSAISPETISILADVIDVYVLEGADTFPASFEDIKGTYTRVGTLRDFITGFASNTVGKLDAGESATLGIALHMQEEADNEYQGLNLGSEFDIRIFATQLNKEPDTFGPDYDINSKYPANYEVVKNVPVIVTKNANDEVIAASLDEEVVINLGAQSNANVTEASVTIPEGASVDPAFVNEDGTADLKPVIKEVSAAPAGVTVTADQDVLPMTIEVEGLADDNTAVVVAYAKIDAGLENVMLYHNSTPMDAIAPADNSFTYDKVTGDLYIYSSSFSPFTVVFDARAALIGNDYYGTLQDAIDAAKDGDVINVLMNITEDVTVTQKAGVKYTINGNGKTFAGVITVDGKSATYIDAGLTIKNLKFKADSISADACIRLGNGTNATRYTCNVTVENCSFDVPGAVAVKSYTGGDKNLTIKDCTTSDAVHSLGQLKGIDGILIKNCTVNSLRGVNFNNSLNVTIDNSTFNVQKYAVRFGEGENTTVETYTINNSKLASTCAEDAVVVFRAGAVNATLKLNNTTIEGTPAFEGVTDATTILVNGAVEVSTADELIAALEKGLDVRMMDNIQIDPASMSNAYGKTGINVKNGQTIDGNGYTLDVKGAGGTWDSGINTTGGVIKNITVTGSFRGIFINHTSDYSEKVVLENVVTGGNGTVYTISCDQGLYQGIEATNCTFNGWTSFAKTAGEAKFVNCSFGEGSGYKFCRPYAPTEFVGCDFIEGYEIYASAAITFEDCTFNGNPLTAENLAALVTGNIQNASVK